MESVHHERSIDSRPMGNVRSLVLMTLLSVVSVSSCSQDEQFVDQQQIVTYDVIPTSSLLDTLPALDKSILYYHIAKNKE